MVVNDSGGADSGSDIGSGGNDGTGGDGGSGAGGGGDDDVGEAMNAEQQIMGRTFWAMSGGESGNTRERRNVCYHWHY